MPQAASEHPPDSMVGTVVDDKYDIVALIGIGSTSNIYRARDAAAQKTVAIKILNEDMVSAPDVCRRFAHEARALTYMTHGGVVAQSASGTTDGRPYIVLEYINGQTLAHVLKENGPLSSQIGVAVFQQACNAMYHCHQLGVVHRGLNPSEIMLAPAQEADEHMVKIVDFGLARSRPSGPEDELIDKLDAPWEVIGSPDYMSPEQRKGTPADARSDIYALGCIMYEALTGRLPFPADTPEAASNKHLTEEAQPLTDAWSVPASLATIVLKAMEKDPLKRYQTMSEMSVALGGKNTQQIKMLNKIGKLHH